MNKSKKGLKIRDTSNLKKERRKVKGILLKTTFITKYKVLMRKTAIHVAVVLAVINRSVAAPNPNLANKFRK